jgi:hypothetical protein
MNFDLEAGLAVLKYLEQAIMEDQRILCASFFESMTEDDIRNAAYVFTIGRLIGKSPKNNIETLAQSLVVKLKSKEGIIQYVSSFPAREVALAMSTCRSHFRK